MRPDRVAALAGPFFFLLLGIVMLLLSLTQPAWLDNRIGPGLFARWLSIAVMGMSAVWLVSAILQSRTGSHTPLNRKKAPSWTCGVGLLLGVATFALTLPFAGLTASCALTALVASWGAGERSIGAFASSATAGALAALALGLTLLPPGTRLWPVGF